MGRPEHYPVDPTLPRNDRRSAASCGRWNRELSAKRLKILFVVPSYFPATRFGGPIKSIQALAKALVGMGTEVSVYTTNSDGPVDLDVPVATPVSLDGVEVTYFQVRWPRRYFYSPALRAALHRTVRKYDLVYLAWLYVYTTAIGARESLEQGVPYVISPRGMLDKNAVAKKSGLKKKVYLATQRRYMRGAAAIHFTSAGERESAIENFPDRQALIVPNGIEFNTQQMASDAELTSLGVPECKPLALFLGRLNYIKGLDILAKAWPEVARKVPTAHLVIAGPDDDHLYESMRREFALQGVLDSVTYVGMVPPNVAASLLRRCSLLVSPSYLESFGMAIVEAMAAGIPVVVTDRVNIARDIAAADAGVVTACSGEAVAQAVAALLQDPGRAAAMGSRGREFARNSYALESTARKMNGAFHSLVKV